MPNVGYATLPVIPSLRGIDAMLRSQLVQPATDAGEKAGQEAGGGLKDKLTAGVKVAGAAAGALLVKGLGDAIGQANITSKLQAQLGSTNKVAAQHGKIAGKLYSSGVSDSFQGAADAIKAVVQSGLAPPGATTKQLQSIATKASDVAGVFDQDLGGVTNAVSQLMRTGLAKNSSQAFDLITRGFQSGADKAGDLVDTINEYGTQFRKAGLDGRTAIGLINQGLKAGARDGDLVADAIKEFSIRAVDGSKGTADGFKALGLNADSMAAKFAKGGKSANGVLDLTLDRLRKVKDPVKQSQIAVALFGTQAEDLGRALFALDPSKAADGLGKVGGAAGRLGKALRSGPGYEIELFKRQLEQGLTNALGTYVLPVLTRLGQALNSTVVPALRAALPPVKSLVSAFINSPTAMRAVAVVLSLLVARFIALKAVAGGKAVVAGMQGMAASARAGAASVRFLAFAVRYYVTIAAQAIVQAVRTGAAWVASGARAAGAWVVARARAVAAFAQTALSATVNALRASAAWVASGARAAGAWAVARARAVAAFAQTALSAVTSALRTSAAWVASGARAAGAWALMRARAVGAFVATAASAVSSAASTAAAWVAAQLRSAVATARATAALVAQRVAMAATAIATRAMAAGQWLLNAAMTANPIGLIIAGLVLLGAGLVLAYKKSATFRAIVQAAMRGTMIAVRALGAAAMWLYHNAILPAFRGIMIYIRVVWFAVRLYIRAWMAIFRALAAVGKWLWRNAILPAFRGISAATRALVSGIRAQFRLAQAGLRALGSVFRWLYNNVIRPVWNGIRNHISMVWRSGIRPAFDAIKRGVNAVRSGFRTAVTAIGRIWNELKAKTRKPVEFVVNTVYGGIRAVWNRVAGLVGLHKLGAVRFARGGSVFGPGTATSDSIPALLSRGEHVWTAAEVRGAGGHGVVEALRAMAASGGTGFAKGGAVPRFAGGGIVDWFSDKARKVGSWVGKGLDFLTNPGKIWSKMTGFIRDKISSLGGMKWAQAIAKIPGKMLSALKDKLVKAAGSFGIGGDAGAHGAGARAAQALARRMLPLFGWGAGQMGPLTRLLNGESGWRWNARNPSSDAYGLFQALPAGKMASAGADWRTNVATQIKWGFGYIKDRYGSPAGAWRAWLSRSPHWYARGTRGAAPGWAVVGERGFELMRMRGGEEIFNHRDSVSMLRGGLPGYAKGTAAAKRARSRARGQVPGDLKSFTKSLTGSASQISSAAKSLTTDLRAAGGAGRRLASSTGRASSRLQSLAGKRDSVAGQITKAKEFATEQAGSLSDFLKLGEDPTAAWMIQGLKERQKKIRAFQGQVNTLGKRGLSRTFLSQAIGEGPGGSLARVLLQASPAEIKKLNALAKSGSKLATSYGNSMADALYDSGSQAGRGFLAGLKAQEKSLQSQMNRLGASLVRSIKRALKIKSPSRVMRDQVGWQVGAGMALGMHRSIPHVAAAADRMVSAAYAYTRQPAPVLSGAQWAAMAPAGHGGSGPRQVHVMQGAQIYPREAVDVDMLADRLEFAARAASF